ncbi:MAG: thiamine pyrophosphate-dependent enzyme [Acidimicrobiia bacterium]|nr:thiamine pyrophosphate-dependent enzyme [Acidimicrobiia bacterium]
MDAGLAAELFEAQVESRLVDHTARWLRAEHGLGYYTIGSAGHESNGAVALALRPTDPALLHYRSGGFYFARATQVADQNPVDDTLRGMLARTTDQISGGRHKVWGSTALNIIPQTSTIASHLPRAVGLAVSIGWGGSRTWPDDAIVVCSLGDASLNHSTAQGALNWASHTAERGRPVPILFVCEDNGLGISVPTPPGWVESSTRSRPGLTWAAAEGHDPAQVLAVTSDLADRVRREGRPGFLHLRTVRFLGHAGTDVETAYRTPAAMRVDLNRDPILGTARAVIDSRICSGVELVDWYLERRDQIRRRAIEISDEPQFESAEEVMRPLLADDRSGVDRRAGELMAAAHPGLSLSPRRALDPGGEPLTLARTINEALALTLAADESAIVFGEDVGRKGGVYGVTRGLQSRFGEDRVFDTILDEQTVLGLALGAALNGHLPIPEIQYLAYLHNAEDQLRGEAATLQFFSDGRYRNPLVIRIASYAYQKGFGGHFHNDNSIAVLRDIPGLIIASPSHPSDAAAMLATCVAEATTNGSVCAYLEPIARYHTTDLHVDGDREWTAPLTTEPVPVGSARTYGAGTDGTILTWGNGLYLSLRARRRLRDDHGEHWRVVDLRWLAPLPIDDLVAESSATGRVLVVDETRHSGGVGEAILAGLLAGGFRGAVDRIAARDSFIPLGAAAELVLLDEDQVVAAARDVGR